MPTHATPPLKAVRLVAAVSSALRSTARRRRALLQLAERDGRIDVALHAGGRIAPGGADMLDLLNDLNGGGLLRWGGLKREHGRTVATYLKA